MKFYSFFSLFIICSTILFAQRLVEREIIINPLFTDLLSTRDDDIFWMSSISAWGGFGHYISSDREHEWYQKLGSVIELIRFGNQSSLSFLSHIEFVANDRNNIGFNPRSLIWEEGFLYSQKLRKSFLQIGYYHRCKHDIENLNEGQERSLIFGGLFCKYIKPITINESFQWSYLVPRIEIYTIRQDFRAPDIFYKFGTNLEQLLGTIAMNFNNHISKSKHLGLFVNSYGSLNFFSKDKGFLDRFSSLHAVRFCGGISTGITVQGSAHFRIGLNFEYFSDNAIDPYPRSSSLLSIGVQIVDPKTIR